MTEKNGLELVGHISLDGAGDLMQIDVIDGVAYVAHAGRSGLGTSIFEVSDPRKPRVLSVIEAPPGTHSHKVQVTDEIMIVNHEKNPSQDADEWSAGVNVFDVSDPSRPREIGFFATTGEGVHRMTFWEPPYAYVSATEDGFVGRLLKIIDLSDPTAPTEAGRWWLPGSHVAGGEEPGWDVGEREYAMHHALLDGPVAYCSWWDGGMVVLDVSDVARPAMISHLELDPSESSCTHTALPLPGRSLVVLADEAVEDNCREVPKRIRLVDTADPAAPRVVNMLPVPEGDYCDRGGRFGPHNLHENRPGRMVDTDTVYVTYFNAGVRVFDLGDPSDPKEIAYYVPEAPPGQSAIQLNDLVVTQDGLIFVTDRIGGGLYIFEHL
ncbi:MAG: LVIVD repeat-containing protein [Actinomycetota bacterium]